VIRDAVNQLRVTARAGRRTDRFRIHALLTTDSNATSTDEPYVHTGNRAGKGLYWETPRAIVYLMGMRDPSVQRAARPSDVAQSYAVRLMQHLVVPTFVLNPRREVVVWNRACERLTGVAAADIIGTRKHWRAFYKEKRFCLADLVALERPDLLSGLYPEFTVSAHGLGFSAENWCVMPKLGNQLYLAIDAGLIHDEDGKLIAVVETLRDMTDQKRAESALQALASSDGLTGLANRRCFDQTLALEWARAQRTKSPLSLLLVDVDHFKLYNDLHGHQRGDDCLRAVAGAMGMNLRPADVAARYGGEEFAVLMPDSAHDAALHVGERLREAICHLHLTHGAPDAGALVTLSIGVATEVPMDEMNSDLLVAKADQALYAAKHSGRDRVLSSECALLTFADKETAARRIERKVRAR
jgi:diguanylate cyclase (GGDEF)-like protein